MVGFIIRNYNDARSPERQNTSFSFIDLSYYMSKQYTFPDDLLTLTVFTDNLFFLLAIRRYKKLQNFITFQAHHVFSCALNTTGPYPQLH